MTSFLPKDQKELQIRLNNLRRVCYPSIKLAIPSFKFKRKEDFQPTDALHHGLNYDIPPSELKNFWQDRETLNASDVDYIIVKGKKWFYNTKEIIGDFYSQDGEKKVEIQFPIWMDAENIWKNSETLSAIKILLEKCSGSTFPTQKEAASCFSQKLLRQIHDKNFSRDAIEQSVLEIMETLRKKLMTYLEKNHIQDILKEPGFITFTQQKNKQQNKPDTQKVKEYLAGNKQALYFLAQKFGLIKNAAHIIRYETMRDHVRHPDEVPPMPIHPRTIYRDFVLALNVPFKNASRAKSYKIFDENIDIVNHLNAMSEIWSILDQHVDQKLVKKKNKAEYYSDLIQKGILTKEEAKIIRRLRLSTNEVSHLNHRIKRARQKVINDIRLTELSSDLRDRHEEIIGRWIKESSYTV